MNMDGSCLGKPELTHLFQPPLIPDISPGLFLMETNETGLITHPTLIDVPSPHAEHLHLQVTDHNAFPRACESTTAAGQRNRIPRRSLSSPTRTLPRATARGEADRHKQKIRLNSSDTEADLIVRYLSQNMLCNDYYGLLASNLPRWTAQGIWHENATETASGILPQTSQAPDAFPHSPYVKLEQAYRVVCQINSRMSDDLVRDRMGLIRLHLEYTEMHRLRRHASSSSGNRTTSTVGRGDASHVIDRILENIHEGWSTLDQTRRAELRAKFHERKKYGKRWSQLADGLGPGILLICSTKLANAVRGTTVTAKMLDAAIERFDLLNPDMVKIIGIVSPLAACLLENKGFRKFETARILRQIQSVCPRVL
ncbi:hypothetical protein BDW66DRAFT_38719 [Aspergillus desertorum]